MPKIVDPHERRLAVADAVFRVVYRDGVEKASLRNIAAEAGLAIGSVRHYFTSHHELMIFAMRELGERVRRRLLKHAETLLSPASSVSPVDRRALTEHLLAEFLPLDEERRQEVVVWLAFITAARTRPQLRPYTRKLYEGIRAVIARALTEAQREGRLIEGLDVTVETERLCALLDGLAVGGVLEPDRMGPYMMIRVLRRHLDSLAAA